MTADVERDEVSFARRFEAALAPIRDVSMRWHIVSVFLALHRLDGSDQKTVVVLAARRMACLYAVAYQCGFRPGDGVVIVSDRLSPLQNPDKWKGSLVILLDDILITGRTFRTRRKALAKTARQKPLGCVIFVARRAKRSYRRSVLPSPMRISKADAQAFSTQLSLVLAEAMIPLITDYPISELRSVSREELVLGIGHPQWRSFEVTNSLAAGKGVRAFTFLPSFDLAEIGLPPEIIEVCKLRVFLRGEGNGYKARVVPIVGFRPVESEAASRYLADLGIETEFAGAGERIAVMNYLASLLFFRWMIDQPTIRILECVTEGCADPWDRELATHYLGERVDGLLHMDREITAPEPADFLAPVFPGPTATGKGSLARFSVLVAKRWSHCLVGDDLVKGVWDSLKRDDPDSLAVIAQRLSTRTEVASLAIDILNDHGSAVPKSRTKKGTDYWGFARGELDEAPPAGEFGGEWASIARTLVFEEGSSSPLAFTP